MIANQKSMVIPLIPPSTGGSFFPMPTGNQTGDLAYWEKRADGGGAWVKLDAPSSSSLLVLTLKNGTISWTETINCDA
jgi:hypothetical protein